MSKISLERAVVGIIAGFVVAVIVSLFISIIAPLVGAIFAVYIAGGNRKRSIIIGAVTAILWSIYGISPLLNGFFVSLALFDVLLALILGIIGGLITHKFFKNNEAKAENPLPLGNLLKNRIVVIILIIIIVVVIILVGLYYIGSLKLDALFIKPTEISNILGGSWTTTTAPHSYGYTENGKYYSSEAIAEFGYKNMSMTIEVANYSNLTTASVSYTNETPFMGEFEENLTKTYVRNGTSQGFNYSFFNGTYIPLCLFNCKNSNTTEGISEILAVNGTYVISMTVYNYSMSLNQATQLAHIELSTSNGR